MHTIQRMSANDSLSMSRWRFRTRYWGGWRDFFLNPLTKGTWNVNVRGTTFQIHTAVNHSKPRHPVRRWQLLTCEASGRRTQWSNALVLCTPGMGGRQQQGLLHTALRLSCGDTAADAAFCVCFPALYQLRTSSAKCMFSFLLMVFLSNLCQRPCCRIAP